MSEVTMLSQLNKNYDPTDSDRAMQTAAKSVALLRICQRVLFANNNNRLIGRDDSVELAVRMRELAVSLQLLPYSPNGKESEDFHRRLSIEAGL